MDEMDEDTLQIHVIFVHLCIVVRCTLYVVRCFFISVLEASKQIFVLVAGFKFLYWFQTFCTGFRFLETDFCTGFRLSVLVSVFCTSCWFQISVCGPENRAKEQTLICLLYVVRCTLYVILCTLYFVLCRLYIVLCTLYFVRCTLYFVLYPQLQTNILPKELFWHYNDDDDNDNNLHHSNESGR